MNDMTSNDRSLAAKIARHLPSIRAKTGNALFDAATFDACKRIEELLSEHESISERRDAVPPHVPTGAGLKQSGFKLTGKYPDGSDCLIFRPKYEEADAASKGFATFEIKTQFELSWDAQQASEPIYQTGFIADQWRDVDRAEYDRAKGLRADLARIVYAAPQAAAPKQEAHSDDVAVDRFACALKDKLSEARAKGREGWEQCDPTELSIMLREHVEKGDPRDVANFCMFLWSLGKSISDAALPMGLRAAPKQAEAPTRIPLLAEDHKGMRVDYSGMFGAAQRALKHGHQETGTAEMLRQFKDHMTELGSRWYAGDTAVVDELLQLYCIEKDARDALLAAPQPAQPAKD
ncbi:hypothetical protein [Pararobbsia silviterrae]|uniref:hypothetical protein n=1 Tax=Pararobbsia silviterrae TaxID=1792498 RepID=UPI001F0C9138|nr:hypothetical protein [Pararobbsia silviterrae]